MNELVPDLAACVTVIRRDGFACVCCSEPLAFGRPFTVRRRNPDAGDSPPNLLTFLGRGEDPLDPGDHAARVASGLDPADEARGFTVPTGQDPALVPVRVSSSLHAEVTVWLNGTEAYATAPPEGLVA